MDIQKFSSQQPIEICGVQMISRRGFLGMLGSFAAAEVARKIYIFPPVGGWRVSPGETLFYLHPEEWSYRYVYRNNITGCVSDGTPRIEQIKHTFAYPEVDVFDIYRRMTGEDYQLVTTVNGWKV